MSTFLLTWNPKRFAFIDLKDVAEAVAAGHVDAIAWSCGNTKSIEQGDRIYMIRQGEEPRGIMASGWVNRGSFLLPHWDEQRKAQGETALYVEFAPDVFLNPEVDELLDVRQFTEAPLSHVNWRTQSSGIRLTDEQAAALGSAWTRHLGPPMLDLGAVPTEMEGLEGELRTAVVAHRSRERALREAKLADALSQSPDGRLKCEVPGCGFEFEAIYGELGKGFAHVHHRLALAEATGPRPTRLSDLAVVCANCHAMIHRGGACRSLEGLIQAKLT
jgi:5-methylcytosine-specific restriction protein A